MTSYRIARSGENCLLSRCLRGPSSSSHTLYQKGNIMNFARRSLCSMIVAAVLLGGAMAHVQTSELHVLVKDAKSAVVSGATVTAAEPGKGFSRSATTNSEGTAILLSLPPGLYSVTVEAPGFARLVNESVRLTIGQVAELAVTLSVASAAEQALLEGRTVRVAIL